MVLQENINKYDFIETIKGKEIIVFGAGDMLYETCDLFSFTCDFNISLVIDNSSNKIGKKILLNGDTYTIYSPDILSEIDVSNKVMLITTKYYKDVINQCSQIDNISHMQCYSYVKINWQESLFDRSMGGLTKLMKKRGLPKEKIEEILDEYKIKSESKDNYLVIPKINLIVTDRCTLKCDKCRALMPDMCNPKDENINQVIDEMDIILDAVDDIIDFEPIGGEPFLYKYLPEVLEHACSSDKINTVVISTNGTIIPNERLLMALKNEKVFVNISDYGYICSLSKLVKCFEDNGVLFEVESNQTWFDVGGTEYRNRNEQQLMDEFENCYCQYLVKYVWNKKIWVCPRAPRLESLCITENNEDYRVLSELDSTEITRQKLYDLYGKRYANACNYCDQGDLKLKYVIAGEQKGRKDKKSEYTLIKRSEYEYLKAMLRCE